MSEIWILGAAGRFGRPIAEHVAAQGESVVLVELDATRAAELAAQIGDAARILTVSSLEEIPQQIARSKPRVVVNTVGPFVKTALPIARACLPATHYVDPANEVLAITALLGLHDRAVAAERCFVTGAGFGVLAIESVVLKLCADRPGAAAVRGDSFPSIASSDRPLGHVLAATLVDLLATGSRRYEDGKLVRMRLGSDVVTLKLPDGSTGVSTPVPSGDLEAARRASGAPSVVTGSSEVPHSRVTGLVLPAITGLTSFRPFRDFLTKRLAGLNANMPTPEDGHVSWARAWVEWEDGQTGEAWLRLGEALKFATGVASEVTMRLARDEARPGVYTPGALFGANLAVELGGEFLLNGSSTSAY